MLLPTITTKQKEILLLLYRFRFLNRIQIQALLKHKNPKNTNVWLKDLTTKNYIGRIFEKAPGINKPAIYFISKNGIKFLKSSEGLEFDYIKKLYQENRRSEQFIDQCIAIANIYLNLESQNLPGFKFYTQTNFPINGVIRDLLPSFAYIREENGQIEQYSCEIIKDGMPRFAIRSRVQKFFEFFKNQDTVTIIFYCQSHKLRQYVEKHTAKLIDTEELEIKVQVQSLF
jgi:hypothetical protein